MKLGKKWQPEPEAQGLAVVSEENASALSTDFAPKPERAKTAKYKRLQVENIWLRAVCEMAAIITAIVLCCVLIISNYEKSFAEHTRLYTAENTMQIAHSLSSIADRTSLSVEDAERREYAADRISAQLDSCFISEDMLYCGAVYKVDGENIELFAASEQYPTALTDNGLLDEEGAPIKELAQILDAASLGEEQSVAIDDVYIALVPLTDEDGLVYSIVAASTTYRTSLDYPSIVRTRVVWISIVCSVLIILYYSISAARSEKKRQNASGKDVVN